MKTVKEVEKLAKSGAWRFEHVVMKAGEIRYFRWGNEPRGSVTAWTCNERGEVVLLGCMDNMEALKKGLVYCCPYS